MSVSTGPSGNIGSDLDVVIEGGPSFVKRLSDLDAAKKKHDEALKALDLGRSAVQANDEAYRRLAEAKEIEAKKTKEADEEVAKIYDQVNVWAETTKADITRRLTEAQSTLDEAKTMKEAAVTANTVAQKTLADARKEAETLVNDANATAADIIARAGKDADKIMAGAKKIDEQARKAVADANEIKARYNTAMDRIKRAIAE